MHTDFSLSVIFLPRFVPVFCQHYNSIITLAETCNTPKGISNNAMKKGDSEKLRTVNDQKS